MNIDNEALNLAITRTIAEKIIAGLDEPMREAFLTKSITESLKDFSISHKIKELVSNKASEVARQVLETDEWVERIRECVEQSLEAYLKVLPEAILSAVLESFHGKSGDSYSRAPGTILAHLKRNT